MCGSCSNRTNTNVYRLSLSHPSPSLTKKWNFQVVSYYLPKVTKWHTPSLRDVIHECSLYSAVHLRGTVVLGRRDSDVGTNAFGPTEKIRGVATTQSGTVFRRPLKRVPAEQLVNASKVLTVKHRYLDFVSPWKTLLGTVGFFSTSFLDLTF